MAVVAIIASLVPAVLATLALIIYVRRADSTFHMWQVLAGYGVLMVGLAAMELAVLVPALSQK